MCVQGFGLLHGLPLEDRRTNNNVSKQGRARIVQRK